MTATIAIIATIASGGAISQPPPPLGVAVAAVASAVPPQLPRGAPSALLDDHEAEYVRNRRLSGDLNRAIGLYCRNAAANPPEDAKASQEWLGGSSGVC